MIVLLPSLVLSSVPHQPYHQVLSLPNSKANFSLQPQFDFGNSFFEGLAAVENNYKWGYIDQSGRVIIKLQFDSAVEFSEGLAALELNYKSGYINKSGEFVIKPQFDSAWSFSQRLAGVEIDGK